jgi:hypothetical protein
MKNPGRIDLRISLANGNGWDTGFNGDRQDAYDYYFGQDFEQGIGFGGCDGLYEQVKCTKVEILENGKWVEITKESLAI